VATFLGLHFDGNVDATGLATVLLAIATFGLALYTRRAVRQGARELEQSQRPVLLPVVDGISETPEAQDERFFLPVINVGLGPAMDIHANLEFGDVRGQPTDAPQIAAWATRTAVGAATQTYLTFDNVALTSAIGFAFNIEFSDVSGKQWFSRGFYSEAEHEYRDVEIVEGPLSEAEKFRLIPRSGHACGHGELPGAEAELSLRARGAGVGRRRPTTAAAAAVTLAAHGFPTGLSASGGSCRAPAGRASQFGARSPCPDA
jgi:hypothetical protein